MSILSLENYENFDITIKVQNEVVIHVENQINQMAIASQIHVHSILWFMNKLNFWQMANGVQLKENQELKNLFIFWTCYKWICEAPVIKELHTTDLNPILIPSGRVSVIVVILIHCHNYDDSDSLHCNLLRPSTMAFRNASLCRRKDETWPPVTHLTSDPGQALCSSKTECLGI